MHLSAGAGARGGRLKRHFTAPLDRNLMPPRRCSWPRYNTQATDCAKRRKRLTAKTERPYIVEIAGHQFGCRMAINAKAYVGLIHSAAVVGDTKQGQAAVLSDNLD